MVIPLLLGRRHYRRRSSRQFNAGPRTRQRTQAAPRSRGARARMCQPGGNPQRRRGKDGRGEHPGGGGLGRDPNTSVRASLRSMPASGARFPAAAAHSAASSTIAAHESDADVADIAMLRRDKTRSASSATAQGSGGRHRSGTRARQRPTARNRSSSPHRPRRQGRGEPTARRQPPRSRSARGGNEAHASSECRHLLDGAEQRPVGRPLDHRNPTRS